MNFRSGYGEQPSGKLDEYLAKQTFALEELFSIPNIIVDIKMNIAKFVKYLSTRKKLTQQLIHYATRLSEDELKQESNRKICFIAIQILSNYSEQLINLFFNEKENDQIKEEISVHNQIQQLLFSDDQMSPAGNDPFQPSKMLEYLLDYLFIGNIDGVPENNYFSKIINNMIRQTGCDLLVFIIKQPKYVEKLIDNIHSLSLGSVLIRILTIDTEECDKKGVTQQQCKDFKISIVQKLKDKYVQNLENLQFCESIGLLIDEGFQSLRNKFFQFPNDLVDAFNKLVSNQTISQLGNIITTTPSNNIFASISIFFTLILKKMNREIQQFYQNQRDKKNLKKMQQDDYILKFEIDWLINNFSALFQLLQKPIFNQNQVFNKHRFTSVLVQLVKVPQLWANQPSIDVVFPSLLTLMQIQSGVLQNDFYIIIKTFIQKSSVKVLQSIPFDKIKSMFKDIIQQQATAINNNTGLGPKIGIIFMLQQKNLNLPSSLTSEQQGISLEEVKTKHNFILGGKQANQSKNNRLIEKDNQEPIQVFEQAVVHLTNEDVENKIQMVGKMKNIALPNLRYMSEARKAKQNQRSQQARTPQQLEAFIQNQKNNVIEIQEQQVTISIPIMVQRQESIPNQHKKLKIAQIQLPQIQINHSQDKVQPKLTSTINQKVKQNESSKSVNIKKTQEPSRQLLRFHSPLYLIM